LQLAKDAGSMVAMTEEEKKRLEQLLEDVAREELPLEVIDERFTLGGNVFSIILFKFQQPY